MVPSLRRTVVVTLAATTLLFGLTSCVKKAKYDSALDKLQVLEGELAKAKEDAAEKDKSIATLRGELGETQAAGGKKEEELKRVRVEKEATEAELIELKRQRDAAEKRLGAYRELQSRFRALVDTGRLGVSFRNGQMLINLPSRVLFPSGSADLSEEGLAALAEITGILKDFRDRRFIIAGHTDTLPIRGKKFKDNWHLSAARAISVVQFMIDAGFPASGLSAAGFGEFSPVAPNDTESTREQNRRIEIIIVPNLEELPTLTDLNP